MIAAVSCPRSLDVLDALQKKINAPIRYQMSFCNQNMCKCMCVCLSLCAFVQVRACVCAYKFVFVCVLETIAPYQM